MSFFKFFPESMAAIAALPDMPTSNELSLDKMTQEEIDAIKSDPERLKKQNVMQNIAESMSPYMEDDLVGLKDQLASRNMKLGKYFNNGNFAMVFEIETLDGKKVESALLRIEPADTAGGADSPAHVKPVMELSHGYFHAVIVPKLEKRDFNMEDMKQTLSVLNAEDKLKLITDMELSQLMALRKPDGNFVTYRDGTIAATIVDLNAINKPDKDLHSLGNVESFATKSNIDIEELLARKVPPEEVAHLRAQHQEVQDHVTAELDKLNINYKSVPTRQNDVNGQVLGAPELDPKSHD